MKEEASRQKGAMQCQGYKDVDAPLNERRSATTIHVCVDSFYKDPFFAEAMLKQHAKYTAFC